MGQHEGGEDSANRYRALPRRRDLDVQPLLRAQRGHDERWRRRRDRGCHEEHSEVSRDLRQLFGFFPGMSLYMGTILDGKKTSRLLSSDTPVS